MLCGDWIASVKFSLPERLPWRSTARPESPLSADRYSVNYCATSRPDSTIIVPVSAYHRGSYAERYSRSMLGDARNRGEVLRDRNVYRGIAERAARPGDDVTDRAHGVLSSSEVVA